MDGTGLASADAGAVEGTRSKASDRARSFGVVSDQLSDGLIGRVGALADREIVALLLHAGIVVERGVRAAYEFERAIVQRLWGVASDQEVRTLNERLSALEARVGGVEATHQTLASNGGKA